MRKVFVYCFFYISLVAFGQVKVASHPLAFKKSKEYQQVVTATNLNNDEIFTFASDKEKITLLHYNAFLFFKDSLVATRPDLSYKNNIGYSFGADENPTLYWSDDSFKNIAAVHYDLVSKQVATQFYRLPLQSESVLYAFNENNTFYLLTKKSSTDALVLYVFKDRKKMQYLLDFSGFEFFNQKKEPLLLSMILSVLPLEKIDTRAFNPLFKATSKSKFYIRKDDILFTLDHNATETQVFQLDFKSNQLLERKIPQLSLKRANGTSNSYYHENKLYQIAANAEELHFGFKDFDSETLLQDFNVTKNDTITFKNSPLWSQTENQAPKIVKNTAKFLNQLSTSSVGVSVYKTPKAFFLTIGGNRFVEQFATQYSPNNGGFDTQMYMTSSNVYFESLFDKKGNHSPARPAPLAIDFINRFSYEHPEAIFQSTFKHKNYFIHAYYDSKLKQFIMRKFYDGL